MNTNVPLNMFSKKKNTSKLNIEQREMYDYARKRSIQKKRLFQHFVVFLVGAVLLIIINVVIGYQEEYKPLGYNWFVWAILIWSFFFFIHLLNVLVINSFMGKEWEQRQLDRLVQKQKERIAEIERKVENDHPIPNKNNDATTIKIERKDKIDPNNPINH